MTEILTPATREEWLQHRTQDVTSTEVAALFGISPYKTEFQLWHEKREGVIVEIEENARMKWGKRLEDPIAQGIAEDFELGPIEKMSEYMRDPELRAGSSFDYKRFPGTQKALFEIKRIGFDVMANECVITDDNIELPPHLEIQVQHQLLVSQFDFASFGVLNGWDKGYHIRRDPDLEIHDAIRAKIKAFWQSVEENRPPQPDFARDAEFVRSLSQRVGGKPYTADEEDNALMLQYASAKRAKDEAEAKQKEIVARILMKAGDAPKIFGNGYTVAAGMVKGSTYTVNRDPYRMFKVTWKK